jgi:hypothetical protein
VVGTAGTGLRKVGDGPDDLAGGTVFTLAGRVVFGVEFIFKVVGLVLFVVGLVFIVDGLVVFVVGLVFLVARLIGSGTTVTMMGSMMILGPGEVGWVPTLRARTGVRQTRSRGSSCMTVACQLLEICTPELLLYTPACWVEPSCKNIL